MVPGCHIIVPFSNCLRLYFYLYLKHKPGDNKDGSDEDEDEGDEDEVAETSEPGGAGSLGRLLLGLHGLL